MEADSLADRIRARLEPADPATPSSSPRVPPEVAGLQFERPIAVGAYGEVWLARSVTGQWRAVKIIDRARFSSPRPFEREFRGIVQYEPISRSHAGLIQVLHVGRDDARGSFFYVMELADDASATVGAGGGAESAGAPLEVRPLRPPVLDPTSYRPRTLAWVLREQRRLPVNEVAVLGTQLATALGHIHRHGLVHRDVKPSNVIFVHGQPKLADVGLVSATDEARSFVGTEGFIPPEGPGSTKADLFALGRLLYEAATGRDRCDFPALPADLEAWSDRESLLELNEVLARLCAPDPARRYGNAAAVAGDLNQLLAGRSLRRSYGLERRLRALTFLASLAIALVVVGTGAGWWLRRQSAEAERRARQESLWRQRAETAEQTARIQLYNALLEQARRAVRSGAMGQRLQSLDALRRAAEITNAAELRREAMAALGQVDLRPGRLLGLPRDLTLVALSPDQRRVAIAAGTNAVEIVSADDGSPAQRLPSSSSQPAIEGRWSADGRYLAVRRRRATRDSLSEVELWELAESRRQPSLPASVYGAVDFHPVQATLAYHDPLGAIVLRDLVTGQDQARYPIDGTVHHLHWAPDGTRLLVQHRVEGAWKTTLLEATTGQTQASMPSGWIDHIAWHPTEPWVALAARSGGVYLHHLATHQTVILGQHQAEVRVVAFTPEGDYLFSVGTDQEVICWDLQRRTREFSAEIPASQVQFAGLGSPLAAVTPEGIRWYDFTRTTALRELAGDLGGQVRLGALAPHGRWVAASGAKRLSIWDPTQPHRPVVVVEAEQVTPAFASSGEELFAFWNRGKGRWRIEQGTETNASLRVIPRPEVISERVYSATYAGPDLVLGREDGLTVVPGATGEAPGPAQHVVMGTVFAEVSRDGQSVAVSKLSENGVGLYTREPWRMHSFVSFPNEVCALAFAPSGNLVVASGGLLSWLDSPRGTLIRRLPVETTPRSRLFFDQEGGSVWIVHDPQHAALHRTSDLEVVLPLPKGMLPLALDTENQSLLVAQGGTRVQCWDLQAVRRELRALGLDWEAHDVAITAPARR